MSKKSLMITNLFVIIGLILLSPWVIQKFKRAPLPVLGGIADFQLLDSQGQTVSQEDFEGTVWVADFIFTRCGGPCPTMTKNMASLHRSYVLEDNVRMATFTVDPEYDKPEVLKEYAKKHEADTSKWIFMTGPRSEIRRLAVESFRVGSVDEPIFHSAYFVLVDEKKRIRGYYDGLDDQAIAALFKDIAFLMRKARKQQKSES